MAKSSRPELRIAPCSHAAAKYACEKWHYSKTIPVGAALKHGAWEDGRFIGAVIWSRGASPWLGKSFGLDISEVAELTRVALGAHCNQVSRIVTISRKLLARQAPGLKLLIAFADPDYGHHGGIYQAMGWQYAGKTKPKKEYLWRGRVLHDRQVARSGTVKEFGRRRAAPRPEDCVARDKAGKHRYVYRLDPAVVLPSLPYPKRLPSRDSAAPAAQAGEGGASPTGGLHA